MLNTKPSKSKPIYHKYGEKNYRIFEIDLLRGILILLVVLDHIMFDFKYFGGFWFYNENFQNSIFLNLFYAGTFYNSNVIRIVIRQFALMLFFMLSGISTNFSRNSLSRGLKMLAFAIVFTLGSNILATLTNSATNIDFNVIHGIAISTLFACLIKKLSTENKFLISIFFVLFYFVLSMSDIYTTSKLLLPFGVSPHGYTCADYLPLIPYMSFFILGTIISSHCYPTKKSLLKEKNRSKIYNPILIVGRNSLLVYLGQQAIFFALFYLIGILANFY